MNQSPEPSPQTAFAEQRRFPRVRHECYARLQALAAPTHRVNHGLSLDLSEGGARVRAFHPMTPATQVQVRLACPELDEAIDALGTVVWSAPAPVHRHWLCGIAFTDLDEPARTRLRQFLAPQPITPLA